MLVGDKIRVDGDFFDLQYCEKNFKTGVGNSKRRVEVQQGDLVTITEVIKKMNENMEKRFQETNSYVGTYREMEEKVGGDNKGKSKELSQKAANGVGQQTGIKNYKLDEKQAVNKCENTARKDRSGERRNTCKDGNGTFKKWVLTRGHDQRTDKSEVLTQQRVGNAEKAVIQHVEERMQSHQRVECTREKGNDFQRLPSEVNQVYRDKSDYNLRYRSAN